MSFEYLSHSPARQTWPDCGMMICLFAGRNRWTCWLHSMHTVYYPGKTFLTFIFKLGDYYLNDLPINNINN